MRSNLQTGRRLLVVSDTVILENTEGRKGYEPVVRELDIIADLFEEITWLGYGHSQTLAPVIAPVSSNIRVVTMPKSGGSGLVAKMNIIFQYPIYLFYILKYLPKATHVHSRAPSHPALIAMLISKWDKGRTYWHKYAGNWVEPHPPKSYARQRSILSKINNPKVFGTVNGYWPGQKNHLLSFENPCLYEQERAGAEECSKDKDFTGKLSLIFVGALSAFKGVIELVKAMEMLDDPQKFSELIIVGNGDLWDELNILASEKTCIKIRLAGSLNRLQVEELYKNAHIIVLPSRSEGFPKVIGEGVAFGCIPVVTNISSLDQYIKQGENGYLLDNNLPETIAHTLNEISIHPAIKGISRNATLLSAKFTYEYYKARIVNEIL
jgi:glycosyltransferase involved in cell wall biosynthesis